MDRTSTVDWNNDKREYVNPSSGVFYNSPLLVLKALKSMPWNSILNEDRTVVAAGRTRRPTDVMTDQQRAVSCREFMDELFICGAECGTYEAETAPRGGSPGRGAGAGAEAALQELLLLILRSSKLPRISAARSYPTCTFMGDARAVLGARDLRPIEGARLHLEYLEEHGHDVYVVEESP